jgi:uncharacterized protein
VEGSPFLPKIENGDRSTVPDRLEAKEIRDRVNAIIRKSDLVVDSTYVCYAARPNSYVIRADGRVGKCTVSLNSTTNTLGRIGDDGDLAIDVDKLKLWMTGFSSLEPRALGCPADYMQLWKEH